MSAVGERIRGRRLELKWTIERLAQEANMSKGFLSDLENGKRSVSAGYLLQIAQALDVTLDYLMKGDRSPSKSADVQIPSSLSQFAKHAGLTYAQTVTILDMRRQIVAHRSSTHSDDLETFDWKKFHEAVKPFLK